MKKIMNLICCLYVFSLQGCVEQTQIQGKEQITVIAQPVMELGNEYILEYLVEGIENSHWLEHSDFWHMAKRSSHDLNYNDSLTIFNPNAEDLRNWRVDNTEFDGKVYKRRFYVYFTPKNIGEVELPSIQHVFNGKVIKNSPYTITIVEKKAAVQPDDILLKLSTNKSTYQVGDTISISLDKYRQFSAAVRIENTDLSYPDSYTGIVELGNYLYNNDFIPVKKTKLDFTIDKIKKQGNQAMMYMPPPPPPGPNEFFGLAFSTEIFLNNSAMKVINEKKYIKSNVFKLKFIPTKQGEYTIPSSKFKYCIYKNKIEYFDHLEGLVEEPNTTLEVESNHLTFKVK